jgi:hypothetical protein
MTGPIKMEEINAIAKQISTGPLGLAYHQPESWAEVANCFANSWRKVELSGGRTIYGWTFHSRMKEGVGDYIFVTHHAVWCRPDGRLVDVTPFHDDPKHHPLTQDGSVLFLVDFKAEPVVRGAVTAPLALRYFARTPSTEIEEYVRQMNEKEQQELAALIERLNNQ